MIPATPDFFTIVSIIAAILYAGCHAALTVGIIRRTTEHEPSRDRVSVVIAAHNEERTIGRLLDVLQAQSVPPHEIIVVVDRSTDATASTARDRTRRHVPVSVIVIDAVPDGKAPKKYAIEQGVGASTGDIILCTDADSIPPRRWVEKMSAAFGPDSPAVIGTYVPGPPADSSGPLYRLFHRFVRYERFRLAVIGLGAAGAGVPWLASGASFAYRKAPFVARGGFAELHRSLSGDDDLLVQRMHRETGRSIGIMPDADAAVLTESPGSFREFFHQRMRHGSATRFYLPSVKWYLGVYHLSNILLTLSLPSALIAGSDALLGCYAVKLSADLFLFSVGEARFRRSRDWVWFVPFEFLYVLYSVVISPLGYMTRHTRWETSET